MAFEKIKTIYETHTVFANVGAGIVGATVLFKWGGRICKWVAMRFKQFAWLFSEQHDHEVIKKSLLRIEAQLTVNDGGSLKDAIDRIENAQSFIKDYVRTSLNTSSKAIFETDMEGAVTHVNRAFLRMTEFSASEMQGYGWVNLISPNCREEVKRTWREANQTGRDFDEIIEYQKPSGERYPVHVTAYVIKNNFGEHLGYVGEATPIEE